MLLALVLLAAAAPPARAWSPKSQVAIAEEAAQLAAPDLAPQLERHADRFREGIVAPFRGTAPEQHYRNAHAGDGTLDQTIFHEVDAAIAALQKFAPFEDIVYRLGIVSHYLADANNPLNASADDPREGEYYADYLRYMQSAEPRFALVFYAGEPEVTTDREMRLLVYRALARSRRDYPLVAAEYARIGYASGVERFDDRSTAFGVAAISFSHAVSDIARVFHYIWLRGGGGDPRQDLWEGQQGLLLLPRATHRR